MKSPSFLLALFLFIACSSQKRLNKIADSDWDSMSQESFVRWDSKRLASFDQKDQLIQGCYKGDIEQSLQEYKKRFLKKDEQPYYWLHIGNCYYLKSDLKKAAFYYRLMLEDAKDPTLKALTNNNLAVIALQNRRWDQARELLKLSAKNHPDLKVPQFNLALLYLQFGHQDRAIAILEGKSFKGFKDIDVYHVLAHAYLYKGNLQKAESYLKLIPQELANREDIAVTHSLYLIRKGEFKNAGKVIKSRTPAGIPEAEFAAKEIESIIEKSVEK